MRLIICLILITSVVSGLKAQNETDALRYSLINPTGTARSIAMGGAFGALGGDMASLSINPAGIGLYRRSELTFTPGFSRANTRSLFYGSAEEDFDFDFHVGSLGLVLTFMGEGEPGTPGFRAVQLGFSINRIANFNNRSIYDGFNTYSSLMTEYLDIAIAENDPSDPGNFHPFTTNLAWETYLLDTLDGRFIVDMEYGGVYQRRETTTSGSIRETTISIGYNYGDRLYFGLALGFPRINFERNFIYTEEEDPRNPHYYFNSLKITDNLQAFGTGINVKFGTIVRATDMIRLGLAFHTPTFYDIQEDFSTSMESDLSFGTFEADSPEGQFEYELNTPLRIIGSLGLVFGTRGLLSIDYEVADFTQMRLRSATEMFREENRVIRNNFDVQHNIRVGGEIRLEPVILRAGYMFNSSPYREGVNDAAANTFSLGFGLRQEGLSFDLGYFFTSHSENYFPYSSYLTLPVSYDFSRHGLVTTIGLRF